MTIFRTLCSSRKKKRADGTRSVDSRLLTLDASIEAIHSILETQIRTYHRKRVSSPVVVTSLISRREGRFFLCIIQCVPSHATLQFFMVDSKKKEGATTTTTTTVCSFLARLQFYIPVLVPVM